MDDIVCILQVYLSFLVVFFTPEFYSCHVLLPFVRNIGISFMR